MWRSTIRASIDEPKSLVLPGLDVDDALQFARDAGHGQDGAEVLFVFVVVVVGDAPVPCRLLPISAGSESGGEECGGEIRGRFV